MGEHFDSIKAVSDGGQKPTLDVGGNLAVGNTSERHITEDYAKMKNLAGSETTMKNMGIADFQIDFGNDDTSSHKDTRDKVGDGADKTASAAQLPDTASGRQLTAFLSALNSGNASELKDYLSKNVPSKNTKDDIEGLIRLGDITGGFDLSKVETSKEKELTALLKERDGDGYARLKLGIDSDEPNQVAQLKVEEVADGAMPGRMTEQDLVKALESKLNEDTAAGKFSGTVAIAKLGANENIFEKATGLADSDKDNPVVNTTDTKFRIASMGKMFTGVAAMQLAEQGKLDLNGKISEYIKDLKDFPRALQDFAAMTSVKELLTHTSGAAGDIFDEKNKTIDDHLKDKFEDQPDKKGQYEYSNMGYMLLGKVIEGASNQDYHVYIKKNIFDKAGMSNTGTQPEGSGVENLANGYTKNLDGKLVSNSDQLPYRGSPAGGGYSTSGDMLRFANSLMANQLFEKPESLKMLTSGQVKTNSGDQYGFGFGVKNDNGVRSFGHGGDFQGISGELRIYPDSRYAVVVLSNSDVGGSRISNYINNRLPDRLQREYE